MIISKNLAIFRSIVGAFIFISIAPYCANSATPAGFNVGVVESCSDFPTAVRALRNDGFVVPVPQEKLQSIHKLVKSDAKFKYMYTKAFSRNGKIIDVLYRITGEDAAQHFFDKAKARFEQSTGLSMKCNTNNHTTNCFYRSGDTVFNIIGKPRNDYFSINASSSCQ